MKDKLEIKNEILFLNRLLTSSYLDRISKKMIKEKISALISELLK
jgi:hypothetical protein